MGEGKVTGREEEIGGGRHVGQCLLAPGEQKPGVVWTPPSLPHPLGGVTRSSQRKKELKVHFCSLLNANAKTVLGCHLHNFFSGKI